MGYFYKALIIIILLISVDSCQNRYDRVELQRSKVPVVIMGKYISWACGDFTPRIMPVSGLDGSISLEKIKYGLTFRVPSDLVAPDQIDEVCIQDNKFELKGFYYFKIFDGKKYLDPQFDLTSWSLIAPYNVWDNSGNKTLYKIVKHSQSSSLKTISSNDFFLGGKYDYDCP